jgi:glutathione S-transferase
MTATLYVVHGSHPCATAERALQLKGLPYKIVEFPPPMHMALMKVMFGERTVPALKVNGEKITGSRAILRRLDELRPEPPLLPADPAERAKVEEAEAWGDEVLQGLVRRVLWPTFKAHPEAMATFSDGSKLPAIPVPVLKLIAPVATRIEMKANDATPATYPVDLRTLPDLLDRVDAWIADGVMGGADPNAADLQIAPSLRLLMAFADLRPLIEARPAGELALRLFPEFPGDVPAGAIPAEFLPAAPAAA